MLPLLFIWVGSHDGCGIPPASPEPGNKDIDMKNTLTSSVLAATIALTSVTATSANAGNNDLRNFIIGATTLFIIGAAISSDSKAKSKPTKSKRQEYKPDHGFSKPRRAGPKKQHAKRKVLPRRCQTTIQGRRGVRTVFGENCLRKRMGSIRGLPERCQRFVRNDHGRRSVYSAKCLRDSGYRVSARRN